MSSRESEFASDLLQLSKQPEFNSISFETIIDKIRAHAAEVGEMQAKLYFPIYILLILP